MALAPTQLGPDMAVSGRRRSDEDRVVRYLNTEGDFEVEVSHTLNKWCVTVFQLPSKQVVAQDFFPERWKALARAQDFVRILNTRNKPQPEPDEEPGSVTRRGPSGSMNGGRLPSRSRSSLACVAYRT